MANNKLLRMDNVGIVVDSLDDAISFFEEIGLKLEGRATVEGEWAGRVTGLGSQNVEIAMMVTPDGHSRLELSRFLTPPTISDHRTAPVNALGYLRSCSPLKTLTKWYPDSLNMVLCSLAKLFSTGTRTGSATFVALKDF
ncbi:hypothetical protein J31TS3_34830 [Paenibacillus lactis]|nr:hypothetical protein J31TS3_34830 [Paenibacillus lactis]